MLCFVAVPCINIKLADLEQPPEKAVSILDKIIIKKIAAGK
jgi:hypothetical protein